MQQEHVTQPPILNQPNRGNVGTVPFGLECLAGVDQLFIKQGVEILEIVIGFETNNRYRIFDNSGRVNLYAKEDTDCCTRNVCGQFRPFDMKIRDTNGEEIIHLYRPLACDSCCFPCCLQSVEIYAPPGNIVGHIEQQWTCIIPHFKIKDASGNVVLRMKGPCCKMSCCCRDVQFQVLSADGLREVGQIRKKWSGLAREMFTDADNFSISFPADLDVRMKAVMIGACMLIDFMYFEDLANSR